MELANELNFAATRCWARSCWEGKWADEKDADLQCKFLE